jgi:hypothetical protein
MSEGLRVLYVTSFAPDMYAATGVHLVESFLASRSDGEMLCCYEGAIEDKSLMERDPIRRYNLDSSEFLRSWLYANRDVIPVALGGEAERCACEYPDESLSTHQPHCPYGWYNKNASRWFRKIVSLEVAMNDKPDVIVWVDSDCRFKERLPSEFWSSLFCEHSVLYHKSPDRDVIESGVIAFRMDTHGIRTLTSVIETYRTGEFRGENRWDDGYIFQQVIERHPEVPSRDLATSSSSLGFVLPSSPLAPFLDHYKGVHGPVLRLMR